MKYHFLGIGFGVGLVCLLFGFEAVLFMVLGACTYSLFDDYNTLQGVKELQEKIKDLEDDLKDDR